MHKLKYVINKLDTSTRLHQCSVPIVAITGGIACGKSTVSKIISNTGHSIIDADQLVKKIYASNEMHQFLGKICPAVIKQGNIDFVELRSLFFSNQDLKESLEKFIYQKLPIVFLKELNQLQLKGEFVFYDVPLLFEKAMEHKVDTYALVYSPRELQLSRLLKRDQISKEQAEKILDTQWNIERKKDLCSLIIDNTSTLSELELRTQEFLNLIQS